MAEIHSLYKLRLFSLNSDKKRSNHFNSKKAPCVMGLGLENHVYIAVNVGLVQDAQISKAAPIPSQTHVKPRLLANASTIVNSRTSK